LDLPDKVCPCRPCYILTKFPEGFDCYTRRTQGCPTIRGQSTFATPLHIIYRSKQLQKSLTGKVRCLRCRTVIDLDETHDEILLVLFRERKMVRDYIKAIKTPLYLEVQQMIKTSWLGKCAVCGQWTSYKTQKDVRMCLACHSILKNRRKKTCKMLWW